MTTEPVLAALEAVHNEIAALREESAALREEIQLLTRRVLAPEDRRQTAALLQGAHSLMGITLWTAAELVEAARRGTAPPEFDQVISDHASAEGGHRSLGRLLARIEGATSGGYRLRKAGNDGQACIFTVVPLSSRSKPVAPLAPSPRLGDDSYTFSGRTKP